jgi:hypothetical protein
LKTLGYISRNLPIAFRQRPVAFSKRDGDPINLALFLAYRCVRCQRPWDKWGCFLKGGFLDYLIPYRSADETEICAGESSGRASRERHSARDTSPFLG